MIEKNLRAVNLSLILIKQILYNEENDVNFTMNKYLSKIDSLLDAHAPFKKLNKKETEISYQIIDYTRAAKLY